MADLWSAGLARSGRVNIHHRPQPRQPQATRARWRDVATTVVARERRSSAYLQKYVESEIAKWAAAMKSSGITPQ